jgi:hypothetical protein
VDDAAALRARILAAHAAGWQVCTHAIGDAAIEPVVDARRLQESGPGAGGAAGLRAPSQRPAAGRAARAATGSGHAMLLDDATIAGSPASAPLSRSSRVRRLAGDTSRPSETCAPPR